VNNFFNLGESSWALPLTRMSLNRHDVRPKEESESPMRLAFIDSASNSITLGKSDFEAVEAILKDKESSVEVR